jgi:inosine/xanthosine triphosphatase
MVEKYGRQGRPLVAIGSMNPAKTKGVRNVFRAFFPGCRFVEVGTSSVARAQPMGLEQVLSGASKRAEFALSNTAASFGVGVEAGIISIAPHRHINLQIAVIVDNEGRSGTGLSCGFLIPEGFIRRMRAEGMELDSYSHELTGAEKIAEEEGIVYHVSKGRVSRLQMTEQCASMALIPWLNRRAYGFSDSGQHQRR